MGILAGYSKQNMISIIDCTVSFILAKGAKIFLCCIDTGWWVSELEQQRKTLFLQSKLQDEIPEVRKRKTSWLLVSSEHVILKITLLDVDEEKMDWHLSQRSGGRGFCKSILRDAKKLRYNHPVLNSLSCCWHRWWRCQDIPSEMNSQSLYCICTFHGWVNPIWNDVVCSADRC